MGIYGSIWDILYYIYIYTNIFYMGVYIGIYREGKGLRMGLNQH